jgi:hypothetical protein
MFRSECVPWISPGKLGEWRYTSIYSLPRWRWVVSFMSQVTDNQGKSPLTKWTKAGGPKARLDILSSARNKIIIPQCPAWSTVVMWNTLTWLQMQMCCVPMCYIISQDFIFWEKKLCVIYPLKIQGEVGMQCMSFFISLYSFYIEITATWVKFLNILDHMPLVATV